jgi:hypothetical protein
MESPLARFRLPVLSCTLLGIASSCADLRIAPSYPGTIFLVAEESPPALAEIEPNGGNLRWRYPTMGPAVAVAVSRNGQFAATIEPSGQVVVDDLGLRRQDGAFRVVGTGQPTGLVFADRRSTLLASFDGSGDLLAFGKGSGQVERTVATGCGSVRGLVLTPDCERATAICDAPASLVTIDLDSFSVRARMATAGLVTSVTSQDEGSEHWNGRWMTIAGSGDLAVHMGGETQRIPIAPPPLQVAADVNGEHVVVSCASTGELVLLEGDGRTIGARLSVGRPAGDRAWPVLVDPIGRNAFVSIPGEDRVVAVDLETRTVRGAYTTLQRPGAIAWAFQRLPPEAGGMDVSK